MITGSVLSECRGKAFRTHFLFREGGDLLDCSVGGLRVGSAAAGLRWRGEGVPALPDQLCGDGFRGDPAVEASLGPLTRCQNRRTTASTPVLVKEVCRLIIRAASRRPIRIRCFSVLSITTKSGRNRKIASLVSSVFRISCKPAGIFLATGRKDRQRPRINSGDWSAGRLLEP